MSVLSSLRSVAAALFRRSSMERQMEEELRLHVQNRADDLEKSGLTRAQAERQARIEFGGYERYKEECREAASAHFFEGLLQDLRFGSRMLRKAPAFTTAAVLTLTLGIGVNTSVFSLIYTLAIRPLPVKDPSTLVSVYQSFHGQRQRGVYGSPSLLSYPEYEHYRDGNHAFNGLAAYAETTVSLSGRDPEVLHGLLASCNYFQVLGADLAAGRGLAPDDCRPSSAGSVAVLSNGFWQREFAGDPVVLGKTLVLDNQRFTIIGITAPGFYGTELQVPDLWVPVTAASQLLPATFETHNWLELPNVSWLHVVGHLKPGISDRRAQAELSVLGRQMDANFPDRTTIVTVNAGSYLNSPELRSVGAWLAVGLLVLAGLVLLMACVNVTNLLLARAAARQSEIAVRLALGAKRSRVIRQLVTESALFAFLAGAAGLFVAYALSPVLVRVLPEMPSSRLPVDWSPDISILSYTVLGSLAATLLSGLVPALHTTKLDLVSAVKESSAMAGQGLARARLRNLLVAAQVAGCTMFLLLASLLVRGLQRAETVNPGFATRNVYAVSLDLSQKGYDGRRADSFIRDLHNRLAALPGVAGVASSAVLPCVTGNLSGIRIPGSKGGTEEAQVWANLVSPDYFSTMEIPVIRGRTFTAAETEHTAIRPAVISLAMARSFWPNEDSIGKEFFSATHGKYNQGYQVVGIAPDIQNEHLGQVDGPFYYAPLTATGNDVLDPKLFVRTNGDLSPVLSAIPGISAQLDASVIVTIEPYTRILSNQLAPARTGVILLGVVGVLAMVLAIVGITGVVSYTASQRAHEFGIRVALGAQRGDLIRLVVRQSVKLIALGLLIGYGLGAGAAVLFYAADLLFGVRPFDPWAFGGTAILLAIVALCSVMVPARQRTAADPILALRHQ